MPEHPISCAQFYDAEGHVVSVVWLGTNGSQLYGAPLDAATVAKLIAALEADFASKAG